MSGARTDLFLVWEGFQEVRGRESRKFKKRARGAWAREGSMWSARLAGEVTGGG